MHEQFCDLFALPFFGVQTLEITSEFDADIHGVHAATVGDGDAHASAFFSCEDARRGSEAHCGEVDTCESGGVHFGGETAIVHVRCADQFKWAIGAAAYADVAKLDKADSGVERGGGEAAHVGRWIDPRLRGLVEPLVAMPPFATNHGEVCAQFALFVKHAGEFAYGHAVTDGDIVPAGE